MIANGLNGILSIATSLKRMNGDRGAPFHAQYLEQTTIAAVHIQLILVQIIKKLFPYKTPIHIKVI
jgi:hypothetical protein